MPLGCSADYAGLGVVEAPVVSSQLVDGAKSYLVILVGTTPLGAVQLDGRSLYVVVLGCASVCGSGVHASLRIGNLTLVRLAHSSAIHPIHGICVFRM